MKTMYYFFADDHFMTHAGKLICKNLPANIRTKTIFCENDLELLESGKWVDDCELLILHMIASTCNQPFPGNGAEKAVSEYCRRGGNILLLHGSSAAFWHWDWWRPIVGFRWVRPNDPDGITPSIHPVAPCSIQVSKVRHPLAKQLRPVKLPADEIYINLEQMNPAVILMETDVQGKTFPQAYLSETPWGGQIAAFIPGHLPECTTNPDLLANISTLVNWLLSHGKNKTK